MKMTKSLLLATTVCAALSAQASTQMGNAVGFRLGTSNAGNTKSTTQNGSSWKSQSGSSSSKSWDMNGGVFLAHTFHHASPLSFGATLGFDMEKTRAKQSISGAESKVQRQYALNLQAKIGHTGLHSKITPYVKLGTALTRFRFDVSTKGGANDANASKTTLGWIAGLGADYELNNTTSVSVQYLYTYYANTKKQLALGGTTYQLYAPKSYNAATFGLSFKI